MTIKKFITSIAESGLEAVKDSAKQVTDTVSPTALVEHALGTKQSNELTQYLKTLSPDLTAEELEKKKKEFESGSQEGIEKARQVIKAAIPDHMKPPEKSKERKPYEQTIQDMERKKAMEVEMQKKQQSAGVAMPISVATKGLPGRKKRTSTTSFESKQNIKIG